MDRRSERSASGAEAVRPEVRALMDRFKFDRLPVEGTLYKDMWKSTLSAETGPAGTAMIGMYCVDPSSVSRFHRLAYDEVWHFYGGDPLVLILLRPDGSSEDVVMGSDVLSGQRCQFVVPAGVWQAGEVRSGGRYSLFGCTMAPGFSGAAFEGGTQEDLLRRWPARALDIRRLAVPGNDVDMPEGFACSPGD